MTDTLPVVGCIASDGNLYRSEDCVPSRLLPPAGELIALTPHALAQAAADERDRLRVERDAAFAMSRCECSPDEACANLAALQAEVEALKKDAERLDWLEARRETTEIFTFPGLDDDYKPIRRWCIGKDQAATRLREAIDAARASVLDDGGTK